ncbi:hypothetical protein AM598_05245, partial [Paenibacillus polymyxa]
YFLIFLILGMIFPLMMSLLQTLSATARGTISSLANSSMYCGTAVGSFTAGMLYAHSGGFISVSLFTVICFSMSLILFLRSGVLKQTHHKWKNHSKDEEDQDFRLAI